MAGLHRTHADGKVRLADDALAAEPLGPGRGIIGSPGIRHVRRMPGWERPSV